jgi:hypothetical protein
VASGLSVYIPSLTDWAAINFVSTTASPLYPSGAKLYVNKELLTELVSPYLSDIPPRFLAGYDFLTKVELNTNTLSVGTEAFAYNTGLTDLKLGGSLQSLSDKAFSGCTSLEHVELDVENLECSASSTSNAPFSRSSGSEMEIFVKNKVKNIAPYLFS